jgi:hypothetical protein
MTNIRLSYFPLLMIRFPLEKLSILFAMGRLAGYLCIKFNRQLISKNEALLLTHLAPLLRNAKPRAPYHFLLSSRP